MSEIPADVMQAAERVAECLNPGTVPHALVMDAAVRTILAERERCAVALGDFLMTKTNLDVLKIVECEEHVRRG